MFLWYAGTKESHTKYARVRQAQKRTQSQYQKWCGERGMWGSCGVRQMTRANSQIA